MENLNQKKYYNYFFTQLMSYESSLPKCIIKNAGVLRDGYCEYVFKDFTFKDYNSCRIELYKNEKLLWRKIYNPGGNGVMSVPGGYEHFQISVDNKFMLFEKYRISMFYDKVKVVEVEISTGKEKCISKNKINPSYSPNGNYILFNQRWSRLPYYYSKNENEIFSIDSAEIAFWLYK